MKPAPVESEDELQWVKEFILFPVILDVLEQDMRTLQTVQLKMPLLYVKNLRQIQKRASLDLFELRGRLRSSGIKIYQQQRTGAGLEAYYLCRGYHRKFFMLWSLVKSEVQIKLSGYMGIDLTEE